MPGFVGGPAGIAGKLGQIGSQVRNIKQELGTFNHLRTARLERTNRLVTGSDHANELTDFANGLRNSAVELKRILGSPALSVDLRTETLRMLRSTSKLLDDIKQALR